AEQAPLLFAVIMFVLLGAAFVVETLVLAFPPRDPRCHWLIKPKSIALLLYAQSIALGSGLLWCSVSGLGWEPSAAPIRLRPRPSCSCASPPPRRSCGRAARARPRRRAGRRRC